MTTRVRDTVSCAWTLSTACFLPPPSTRPPAYRAGMPAVQLNTDQFNTRLKHLLDAWNVSFASDVVTYPFLQGFQSAGKNDDCESISGADGLLLSAGDPAEPDEPIKKSVALQVSPIIRDTSDLLGI